MGGRVIAVAAACVVLVVGAARAQSGPTVLAPTVSATRALPAGAVTAFTVGCRQGFVAVAAGVSSRAPGTTVLSRTPVGPAAYRFRIGNPLANGDQRVTVAVACRKLARSVAVFALRRLKPKPVVVPARATASVVLACPRGTTPANGGFDLRPRAKSAGSFSGLSLSVRRRTATLTASSYAVQNADSQSRVVQVNGACLTLLRPAGAPFEQLHVARTTSRIPLPPGVHTVARSCRAGWFALDAGFALHGATALAASAVTGNGARWTFENRAAGPTLVDVQLACARVGP
jgi:hypothetical protein